jgi:hypothetical protein
VTVRRGEHFWTSVADRSRVGDVEPRSNLNIKLRDCECRFRKAVPAYAFGQIPVRSRLVIVEAKICRPKPNWAGTGEFLEP